MIITTVQTYKYETWRGKSLRLFDTDTGIGYRFTLTAGDNVPDAVRLSIESAHSPVAENEYGLEYHNEEAIQFMRQMTELVEDKSLIDHWCEEAIKYLDAHKAREAEAERARTAYKEMDTLDY